ncbi:uncharacterized protein LOC135383517 [Ornithodoros turicata]|uniref:uncharacterized protein LOC135383517 n=1 Tax=Ornithodoros turicata TaxID=34597 RepID=UPI003138BC41
MQETKRSVLQASARVFDPLGFLSPYTIRVKLLFQKLWKTRLDWDDPLPNDLAKPWRLWCSELPQLCNVAVDRCVLPKTGTRYCCELHIFTDASPHAYGACAYLRTVSDAEETKSSLQVAKCDTKFWTDSTVTLNWIRGEANRWKPFVRNRVIEIQEGCNKSQWRHCPGSANPADFLTRGLPVTALMGDKQWFEGPPWLSKSQEFWPISTENGCGHLSHIEEERKRGAIMTTYVETAVPALLDLGKYSDYQRILRITAWILRFVENGRATSKVTGPLTAMEVEKAEMFWIRRAQNESYPEELLALRQRREIAQGSKIARLRP